MKKDLRTFVGSVGYNRDCIKSFARYSSVLSPATSKAAPGRVVWTSEWLEAFDDLKCKLCDHCLTIPVPSDSYSLHADASARGLGAVLKRGINYQLPFTAGNSDSLLCHGAGGPGSC